MSNDINKRLKTTKIERLKAFSTKVGKNKASFDICKAITNLLTFIDESKTQNVSINLISLKLLNSGRKQINLSVNSKSLDASNSRVTGHLGLSWKNTYSHVTRHNLSSNRNVS